MVSTSEIFNVLSDTNYLMLFSAIASKTVEELIPKLSISESECNFIISVLMDVGLVRRQGDRVSLTNLGKVYYYAYNKLSNAMDYSWKLKCIDILEESDKMPQTEIHRIINITITDKIIREILKGEV
jgi:predicted transcriptional regulator